MQPARVYKRLAGLGLVLLAERKDEALGFAAFEIYPDALHLMELGVRFEAQGQGVGRALVAAVCGEARQRDLPAVTLTTFADLPWNAPWYARLGFAELGPGRLGERLRQELQNEYERGLSERCAMRLAL